MQENQNQVQSQELNGIFNKIKQEKNPKIIKKLCHYIAKNRQYTDEIIKKISLFINANDESIPVYIILKTITSVLDLLKENSQMINFLNMILPILVHLIYYNNRTISELDNIINTIGTLIKNRGIYIRQIIESKLEELFDKFSNDSTSFKFENTKYAMIKLLVILINNSPTISFNKIAEKTTFEIFLKILDNFKDTKEEIRKSIGDLTNSFLLTINNRDKKTQNDYLNLIFERVMKQYIKYIQDNNPPTNHLIVNGFIIIIKNFNSRKEFIKLKFETIMSYLLCCKNSRNNHIKISFIDFLPFIAECDLDKFCNEYSHLVLPFMKDILTQKLNNTELRNSVLNSFGKFSLLLPKNDKFSVYFIHVIDYVLYCFEKDIIEPSILDCLSNIMNSYRQEVVNKLNISIINKIFSKIFRIGFYSYHMNFINQSLNSYTETTIEHITILATVLNVASLIICDQFFCFNESIKYISDNRYDINTICDKDYLNSVKKSLTIYINNNLNNNFNVKDELIANAMSYIKNINHRYFTKDTLCFYQAFCLSYLSKDASSNNNNVNSNNNELINNNLSINQIKVKCIELSTSNWLRIYKDDINNTKFILSNILDAYLSVIFNDNEDEIKYKMLRSIDERFFSLLETEKFFHKLISILSLSDKEIKKLTIRLLGQIAYNNPNNSYIQLFIKNTIFKMLIDISNDDNQLQKEEETSNLYYFILYTKKFLKITEIKMIFSTLTPLIDNYISNQYINVYILKIVCEIVKGENFIFINKNKKNIINEDYEVINNFLNKIFDICMNNLKEGLNNNKLQVSLKTMYHIIQKKKIDIYDLKNVDEINIPKLELITILLQLLMRDSIKSSRKYILEIFGFCGVMTPEELEKLYYNNTDRKRYNLKALNYNNSNSNNNYNYDQMELFSNTDVDQCTKQAVISLMRILKDNSQQELSTQVISCLGGLIKSLQATDSPLIDIILPTIIEMIPQFEQSYAKSMFENLVIILRNFKDKFYCYIDPFINIIKIYLTQDNFHDIVFQVLPKLFTEFNLEKYYSIFIPTFIKLIKLKSPETKNIIQCFSLMAPKLASYLGNVLSDILQLYIESDNEEICNSILIFIENIIYIDNIIYHLPQIIHKLLNKITLSKKYSEKTLDIFIKMNNNLREQFITFLPLIIKTYRVLENYKYLYFKIKNNLLKEPDILSQIANQKCLFKCCLGINNHKTEELINNSNPNNPTQFSPNAIPNNKIGSTQIPSSNMKNRKTQTDRDLIVRVFDTSHCTVEEDWREWFKSTSKILFEQSPSYALFYCHMVADYYFPLIVELYNYGFISVWRNFNDSHKMSIVYNLNNALNNKTTPNDVLLTILNLAEFIEREENHNDFIDFNKLGQVALSCQAYAKALYYKEVDFRNKNDFNASEELISLYHELKLPESAIGILKLALKSNDNKLISKDNWFVKLHQWKEGLEVIEKELDNLTINKINNEIINSDNNNNNDNNINKNSNNNNNNLLDNINNNDNQNPKSENKAKEELINMKIQCLDGLGDWESLLSMDDEMNLSGINNIGTINTSTNKSNKNSFILNSLNNNSNCDNDLILVLAKASMNLSNWDKLKEYTKLIVEDKDDESKYYKNFYESILEIQNENYSQAKIFIANAQKDIDAKIKSLLAESYGRGYDLLIKNELLYHIEEIIDYKTSKINKEELLDVWDNRLKYINEDSIKFEKVLAIRSIILNMNEDYKNYLKLSKLFRKEDQFDTSLKILDRMKNKLNSSLTNDDILIKIELCRNKCLFENGQELAAINNAKSIITEMNLNNIDDIIKSKVYGYFAIFSIYNLDINKENSEDNLKNILQYLELSTKYNKLNYRSWHAYALLNYKYFEHLYNEKNSNSYNYAVNAVNGFTNSICIGGKIMSKIYQDLLRLLDIWFNIGSIKDMPNILKKSFSQIDLQGFLLVIPQLLARIDIQDTIIVEMLHNLLLKIGNSYPRALLYPLIVMQKSRSQKRINASTKILNQMNNEHIYLIKECSMFIDELNRCALLLHEQWCDAIDEALTYFNSQDINGMIKTLLGVHEKMHIPPETINEVHFHQIYKSALLEAELNLLNYLETNNEIELKEAWILYHSIYKSIGEQFKNVKVLDLDNVSPRLSNFQDSKICVPGLYTGGNSFNLDTDDSNLIRISHMSKSLSVFSTKQHPRKISLYGTNGKEYMFLLKGHEDLRQDERAMQLFNLVNTLLANDRATTHKNLFIECFSVIPLSQNTGILGWVPNCDTLHQLIKEYRTNNKIIQNTEHRLMYSLHPKFESSAFLNKVEIFKSALQNTMGLEIYRILWTKSKNSEAWLERRTNYSRSLAVMSMVGYILGLGDRHPSNLMLDRYSGKIIHIDFGDCFEVAMKREFFPERVPFRLTRMLIKALEVSGIEGTFRITCEKVMKLLRENKDSLLAILASFIHDPLISFRLLIPMIMKKNKINQQMGEHKNKFEEKNNNNNNVNINNNNNEKIKTDEDNEKIRNEEENEKAKNDEDNDKNNEDDNKNEDAKRSRRYSNEKIEEKEIIEDNYDKKKVESAERQLFTKFLEKDELESDELNKIAKIVVERINDKLQGSDFYKDIILDVKSQVEKLINQATSHENLAQSYLGWCPFW